VDYNRLSPALRSNLDAFQSRWGTPFKFNSGYRDPSHNARVGGASGSQHIHGNAVDVDVSHLSQADRIRKIQMAREMGMGGIGVYKNALHFDVGKQRAWGPDYTSGSIPDWSKNALGMAQAAQQEMASPQRQAKPEASMQGFGSTDPTYKMQDTGNAFSAVQPKWSDGNSKITWSDGSSNAFGPQW
jgi:Peptidase M15